MVASATSTARRTSAACVLGSVRQSRYKGRSGFQLATRRMAASNAAASSNATATATTWPSARGGSVAATAGGSCSDGVIFVSILAGAVTGTVRPVANRLLTNTGRSGIGHYR
jgi:hypothetical protein